MTKVLNPVIIQLAGRRHFLMAAQIRPVGERFRPGVRDARGAAQPLAAVQTVVARPPCRPACLRRNAALRCPTPGA